MAEAVWGAFFIVFIIGLSLAGASTVLKYIDANKECAKNTDCAQSQYCGSDFKCHEYPSVMITNVESDWTRPATILGLSIVLGALILRRRR